MSYSHITHLCQVECEKCEFLAIFEMNQACVRHSRIGQTEHREVLAISEEGQPNVTHLRMGQIEGRQVLAVLEMTQSRIANGCNSQIDSSQVLATFEVGQPGIVHFRVPYQEDGCEFKCRGGQFGRRVPELSLLAVLFDRDGTTDRPHILGGAAVGTHGRLDHAAVPFDLAPRQRGRELLHACFSDLCHCDVKVTKVRPVGQIDQPRITHLCTCQINMFEVFAILEVSQPRIGHLRVA